MRPNLKVVCHKKTDGNFSIKYSPAELGTMATIVNSFYRKTYPIFHLDVVKFLSKEIASEVSREHQKSIE